MEWQSERMKFPLERLRGVELNQSRKEKRIMQKLWYRAKFSGPGIEA